MVNGYCWYEWEIIGFQESNGWKDGKPRMLGSRSREKGMLQTKIDGETKVQFGLQKGQKRREQV